MSFSDLIAQISTSVAAIITTTLNNPTDIANELGKTLTQVTIGVFVAILVSVLREGLKPLFSAQEQTAEQARRMADHITTKREGPKVKAEPPAYYDGSPDRVQAFLTEISMYFGLVGEGDPDRQVVYALSRIQGGKDKSATKWADAKRLAIRQYHDKTAGKTAEQITAEGLVHPMYGWTAFKDQFEKHFMLHNENEMARDALDILVMGSKSCEEYTTMFNGYAEMAQYDEVYLLRKYQEGLNKALRDKVLGTYPAPEDLKNWKERALNLDRAWRKSQTKKNIKPEVKPFTPYRKPEPKRDPNAMDIDRISVEEQQDLMKKGACFYCKESGHLAKNCPKKGRMPARDQKKPERRNINFARTEDRKDGAEEAYNEVQKALSSLSEEDYQKFQDIQNRRGGF